MISKFFLKPDLPRITSSLVLVIFLILWIYFDFFCHLFVLGIIGLLIAYECLTLSRYPLRLVVLIGGALALGLGFGGSYVVIPMDAITEMTGASRGYALRAGSLVLGVITCAFVLWLRFIVRDTRVLKRSRPWIKGVMTFLVIVYVGFAIGSCSLVFNALEPGRCVSFIAPFWFTIIATDIGAYIGGRWIGGSKLASWVSPGKTWSGACSGIVCSMLCAWIAPRLWGYFSWDQVILISLLSQMGDALESGFKRYCGAKDSGTLIPGHGGVFDRLDGYVGVHSALGWGLMLV